MGNESSSSLTTQIDLTSIPNTDTCVQVAFSGIANAGGTLIPRVAQDSHSTGTVTVQVNSTFDMKASGN